MARHPRHGEGGVRACPRLDDSGQLVALSIAGTERTNVELVKPLSTGSTMNGIDRDDDGRFYLVNSVGQLFTTSAIDDWSKTELTDTSLVDIVVDTNQVYTATSGGTLLTYSPDGGSTKKPDLSSGTVYGLDRGGDRIVASGTGGQVVEVTGDKPTIQETPVNVSHYGLAFGSTIAVGGSGSFVVRKRGGDEASKDESKQSTRDGSKQESAEAKTKRAASEGKTKQRSTKDAPTPEASKQEAPKQEATEKPPNKGRSAASASNDSNEGGSDAGDAGRDNSDEDDPDDADDDDADDDSSEKGSGGANATSNSS